MENEEPVQLYVSDPVLNKDGVNQFTSYTLQGAKLQESLSRRYRDFDALRKKFVERWPGIYIPNIPHKKIVGSTDKDIVGFRIEQINRFLKKISRIDYLFNSDEMELFLQHTTNVPKNLENIKEDSYQNLLKRYSSVFTDYDDNFDTIAGKNEQDQFYKRLLELLPKLRNFRAFISQEKDRYKAVRQNYLAVLNTLSLYEKDIIDAYVGSDENKLVLFNMKNIDLCKNVSNVKEKMINPYERIFDSITEDFFDAEAMQEALEGLKGLQENYNKLTKNLTSTNVQLNDLQAGKTNVKNLLRFKGKEENISTLMADKERLEKDIDYLGQIIKIATFNMQNQIKKYKTVSLENYYSQLKMIAKDTEFDAKISDDLWETIVKDKNISEFN